MRDALLATLEGNAEARRDADSKIHVVVDDNQTGYVIETAEATEIPPDFHPSGNWVLIPRNTSPRPNTAKESVGAIFNVGDRKLSTYQTDIADFRGTKFVLGGKYVLFGSVIELVRGERANAFPP